MIAAMSGARALLQLVALLAAGLGLCGQDQEVSGRVTDTAGRPIAGADVGFLPLPVEARPRAGGKGRYQLARAAHRAATKLPRTRTDRDGVFRCLLSPQLAALADGAGVELAMQVRAPGYRTWMRAIGDRLDGAALPVAILSPAADGPLLRVRIATAVEGPYRGFALVERAYRARPDRSVWLRQLLPVSGTGEFSYDEPARVPGEVAAALPTARPEGYRVTLFLAGLDRWQRTLGEGSHEVRPERSGEPPRRVLADRSEPARPPLEATYELAGEEVTLALDEPRVPLLGGEAPSRVHSASGPVPVDAWDPELPLFVEAAGETSRPTAAPARAADSKTVEIAVAGRRNEPLYGAAVWVEDAAARAMPAGRRPYAVTDPMGRARIEALPAGVHWLLVRHPNMGEREVLVDTAQPGPVTVVLRSAAAGSGPGAAELRPATLLLDLGDAGSAAEQVEVGIVQPGARMLRRTFSEPLRQIRLEGLSAGPCTVWARLDERPACVVGGALAMEQEGECIHPLRAVEQTFVLDVRDAQGAVAEGPYVSLGESTPRGGRPLTTALFELTPAQPPGRHRLRVRLVGDVWVVVHGAAGERRDLLLSTEGRSEVITVSLPPPPPPPAKGAGEGEQGGAVEGQERPPRVEGPPPPVRKGCPAS
jgi:hypothetical protein